MPLSRHGERMLSMMKEEYGDKKGEQVLYASMNAGKPGFQDIHGAVKRRMKRGK